MGSAANGSQRLPSRAGPAATAASRGNRRHEELPNSAAEPPQGSQGIGWRRRIFAHSGGRA